MSNNAIIKLPELGDKKIEFNHFPTRMQAFILRNWDIVPKERLAQCIGCTEEQIEAQAFKMGLKPQGDVSAWLKQGYISVIKVNWQLIPYEQLLFLLGWDEDKLAFVLKEEDFLKFKLGDRKTPCEKITYRELTPEEEEKTKTIKRIIEEYIIEKDTDKAPFDFFGSGDCLPDAVAELDEKTVIDSGWYINDETKNETVAIMANRFKAFAKKNYGIAFDGNRCSLSLRLFDDKKAEEYHEIEICDSCINITAADSAGILRALTFLEDMAQTNGAFAFDKGSFKRKAAFKTRFIYSFCGLYNDALDVDSSIWLPDALLESYAKTGINGIWIAAILYKMIRFPFEPKLSEGYEMRMENLRRLIKRTAAYGVKVFVYFNEPRAMYPVVFEKYPHLMGARRKGLVSMCTSTPEVQDYLREGISEVCKGADGLGGVFLITASENLTNCHSRAGENDRECPVCSKRPMWEVVSEVNNIIAKAVHDTNPEIKVICWDWGWNRPGYMPEEDVKKCIESLPDYAIVMCNRECGIPVDIDGVKGVVDDYSLAISGVSKMSEKEWKWAKESGHETSAKLQLSNTWECSTIPYLPVFTRVEEIVDCIKERGVEHIMVSWTLGGYPSPNIKIASDKFFETETDSDINRDIYEVVYGKDGEKVKKAAKVFSDAFSNFPFEFEGVYRGPANGGAANLLYDTPSGLNATMTCYAHDDLTSWRTIFPEEIYENRFRIMSENWSDGLKVIDDISNEELKSMAEAVYVQLRSGYNQIRFVRSREAGDINTMIDIARDEQKNAAKLHALMQKYPSIGFEAANHYYYTKGMLKEKIVNCQYIIDKYTK